MPARTVDAAAQHGIIAQFLHQGPKQPGEPARWKVWGASCVDIQAGDVVGLKRDDEPEFLVIAEVIPYDGSMMDMIRPRFTTLAGEVISIGRLQPVIVYRSGTCSTLADSVR